MEIAYYNDIWYEIFTHLEIIDLLNLRLICKNFKNIIDNSILLKKISLKGLKVLYYTDLLLYMCDIGNIDALFICACLLFKEHNYILSSEYLSTYFDMGGIPAVYENIVFIGSGIIIEEYTLTQRNVIIYLHVNDCLHLRLGFYDPVKDWCDEYNKNKHNSDAKYQPPLIIFPNLNDGKEEESTELMEIDEELSSDYYLHPEEKEQMINEALGFINRNFLDDEDCDPNDIYNYELISRDQCGSLRRGLYYEYSLQYNGLIDVAISKIRKTEHKIFE